MVFLLPLPALAEFDDADYDPNIFERGASGLVRNVAIVIDKVFFSNDEITIDSLIYNAGADDHMNLTLLGKYPELQRFFLEFFLIFQYLAVIIFIPIGIVLGYYFARAGDNAQRRAELKDRLSRWGITFVLLTAMPEIISMFFSVNGVFVSVFQSIGTGRLGTEGTFLLEYFKEQAIETRTFTHAVVYLMSVFLNVWIVIVYFIRDLTISFLFIIFPIFAVFYPLQKNMVVTWFKEMFSNIFTQSIHAILFTVTVIMAYEFGKPESQTFVTMIYTLVAFAMIIPFTGIIKRLLGMEGSIGAAASMAGLGGLFALYHLGRGLTSRMSKATSNIVGGTKDWISANSDEKRLAKNLPSTKDQNLSPTQNASRDLTIESINERRKEARGRVLKGLGAASGGAAFTAIGTLGAMPFGGRTAMMVGAGAGMVGAKAGSGAVAGTSYAFSSMVNTAKHAYQSDVVGRTLDNVADKLGYETNFTDQERVNKYVGLTSPQIQNTRFQKQEQKAVIAKKMYEALGMKEVGNLRYASITPNRKSLEELRSISNAKLYVDKDMSFIYTENDKGENEILWTGEGNRNLETPTIQGVSFNDGSLNISRRKTEMLYDQAREYALSATNDPEKQRALLNNEFNRLKNQELQATLNLREKTGFENINAVGTPIKATRNTMQHKSIEQAMLKKPEELKELKLEEAFVPINDVIPKGIEQATGYSVTTKNLTTIYADDGSGGARLVGVAPGDTSMQPNSMAYAGVRFKDGKVLQDKIKYALEGTTINPNMQNTVPYNKEMISNINTSSVQPNDEVIVTVSKEGDKAYLNAINASTGQYLGNQIADNANSLKDNTVFHIKVDQQGTWHQCYHGNPTDIDIHMGMEAKLQSGRLEPEIMAHRKQIQLETFREQLKQMESYYSTAEVNIDEELISST